MSKENIDLIKRYLNNYTIETTPNVYKKYISFSGIVDKSHSIYITYLPDEDSKNVIETAKKLILEGYDVIPHLPSRTMETKSDLEKYIAKAKGDRKKKAELELRTFLDKEKARKEKEDRDRQASIQSQIRTRRDAGESLSDIGRDMFTGPGKAFEKRSGGFSEDSSGNRRYYGGR